MFWAPMQSLVRHKQECSISTYLTNECSNFELLNQRRRQVFMLLPVFLSVSTRDDFRRWIVLTLITNRWVLVLRNLTS